MQLRCFNLFLPKNQVLKTLSFCRLGAFVHGALVRAPSKVWQMHHLVELQLLDSYRNMKNCLYFRKYIPYLVELKLLDSYRNLNNCLYFSVYIYVYYVCIYTLNKINEYMYIFRGSRG